ncbi:SGNH/GDSL hydrolase family protein [Lactiplantibacillus pentosus]|uniref:SGNH/GDSL hydrolase family protein n=1 Tax=Lactiplantibacillus pentosus TaxID=1589 RepID=UPI001CDBFEF9|nr:SGNH/GDSL hydrolase family protein [Lactiplantibacillus pentosus]
MAIQLVTDQFSDNLDGTFRNGMVGNFKIVEQTLNELLTYQGNINKQLSTLTTNINTSVDGKLTKQDSVLVDKLKAQSQDLTKRINHIIMGTDTDSIHAVLNKMILDGELRGQRGDAGKDGRDGLDGESAYQIWLDAGNVGSKADYLASMKGKPGDKGPMGPAGKDGAMSSADVDKMVSDSLQYQTVPDGTDLLTLINNTGRTQYYSCGKAADAKTMSNVPMVTAFNLIARPVNPANQTTADNGNPIWAYTTLEFRPYNSGLVYVASTTTDGDGKLTSTPWTLLGSNAAVTSILYGKTLDIIGDSYVANNGQPVSQTWHYKIANQHSMKYNNYGINGNGLITTKATGTPVVNRVGDMDSSADYVIVVGGKNDYNQQLGITDFKSGLVKLIQELVERFVGKKICFFTPWSIVDSETMNIPLAQYSQAIEDVCGAYSIPCFNSAKRSGILAYSGAFQTKYFQTSTDCSHLNSAGHDLFVNPATKFLESL